MPVSFSRSGSIVTVVVTVNVSDIIAAGITNQEKKDQAIKRAAAELLTAAETHNRTDADIDAGVTVAQAEATRLKASRPTGNL